MRKMYLRKEDRNDYERETGRASYDTIVREFIGNIVRCDKVMEVDEFLFDYIIVGDFGELPDIYQAYICNVDQWNIDQLKELSCDEIILAYSQLLETEVLLVTHCGTSWKHVGTNVLLTDEI